MKKTTIMAILAASLFLNGCAKMSSVDSSQLVLTPESGKSLVFFVRPSNSYAASLNNAREGSAAIYAGDRFVGLLLPNTHLAVQLLPGRYVFMVMGESTNYLRAVSMGESPDFVRAELLPDKIYYVKVQPQSESRMDARFAMEANNGQFPGSDLRTWTNTPQYAVNGRGEAWANENAGTVSRIRDRFLPKWEERIARDKRKADIHTLRPESGI